jgi:Zn finger protein HypA/HybF involved in hydrogenase expression
MVFTKKISVIMENTMTYNKCICQKCESHFATMINDYSEIAKEACPKCGERKLKISEPLSFSEMSRLFSGGG